MRTSKKLLSVLLAVLMAAMTMSCLTVCAYATGGTDGGIAWDYDSSTQTLTISRKTSGVMPDYDYQEYYLYYVSPSPWYSYSSSIESVIIKNGVRHIGDAAFFSCTNLTSVTIEGSSLQSVGNSAFYGCNALTRANIADLAAWCKIDFDDETDIYNRSKYSSNPLSLGAELFCNGMLVTNLTVPSDVSSIGRRAFSGYTGLSIVTIPDSVISIGADAFSDCSGLRKVYYTGDIAAWCAISFGTETSNPLANGAGLYINDTIVRTVSIPNGLTSIGDYAFYGYTGFARLVIPSGVTSIGIGAFSGCTGLTIMAIPSSVTSIGSGAFNGCTGLTSVVIPNGVTEIEARTFKNCTGLTSVTIPGSVTSVGDAAFEGCTGLARVNIKDLAAWCSIDFYYSSGTYSSNPLSNGAALYLNGALVTDMAIPSGVTHIGGGAFFGCTSLTSVTIPGGVTEIGAVTFKDCIDLTSVSIPRGVTEISYNAFEGCTSLASVTIPDGVTIVREKAFRGCTGLTSVTIPNSVTEIERSAFEGCTSLTEVALPTGLTSIDNNLFKGCANLRWVAVPVSVTRIWGGAFDGTGTMDIFYAGSKAQGNQIGLQYLDEDKTIHYNCNLNDPEVFAIEVCDRSTDLDDDGGSGTLTGGGIYLRGETATLTATPAAGSVFDHWYFAQGDYSLAEATDEAYSFTVTRNQTYYAVFRRSDEQYTVSVNTEGVGGTTSWAGSQSYLINDSATVSAVPAQGYYFDGWYRNGVLVSRAAQYTIPRVTENVELTARFGSMEGFMHFGCYLTAGESGSEIVMPAGPYDAVVGDVLHSEEYQVDFPGELKEGDRYIDTVAFAEAVAQLGSVDNLEEGLGSAFAVFLGSIFLCQYGCYDPQSDVCVAVNDSGVYTVVEPVALDAMSAESDMTNFLLYGFILSTSVKTYHAPVPTYTVTANASAGGSATGGNTYESGATATLTATPGSGYHFTGWYEGSINVSDKTPYSFTVTKDVTLTAQFEKDADPDNNGGNNNPQPQPSPNRCHWCGKDHSGNFFQKIIGFFHNIFAKIFGNKY